MGLLRPSASAQRRHLCSASDDSKMSRLSQFESLAVTRPSPFVVQVELNRPNKLNAMNRAFWKEMVECFTLLSHDPDCRSVVLSGAGKVFTAGLDLKDFADFFGKLTEDTDEGDDPARRAMRLRHVIAEMQDTFSVIERCPKPVVAAVHGACIGGGVDMISACDVRYCSQDAWFVIKEVDLGLAADVGTLQRFPKIVGNDSLVRELAYSCDKLTADRAQQIGFVSKVCDDAESTRAAALELANRIAERSPVAVQGTKVNLNYSRNHSIDESLHFQALWNAGMLQTEDLVRAGMAHMSKQKPVFSKL